MANFIKLRTGAAQDPSTRTFDAEHFGEAILLQGHVALRETVELTVNDAPGQCWGEYIEAAAGSYDCVECRTLDRDTSWCIDSEGAKVELITLADRFQMRPEYRCYMGSAPLRHREKPKAQRYKRIANFRVRPMKDPEGGLEICCVEDDRELILLPAYYGGQKIRRADLRGCRLSNCRCLIVDSHIRELMVDLYNAEHLERIEIARSTKIIGGPGFVNTTPWFSAQPKGQVYLAGWYCGSRGGTDMGQSCLKLREDCVGVAPNADRCSYWKKIIFPPSVETIGSFAFSSMDCLESIEFSEGLKTVGETVFWHCPRLRELELPDSMDRPGPFSFDMLPALERASMNHRSYSNSEFFLSVCGELIIRGRPKGSPKLRSRPRPDRKPSGKLSAYAKGSSLYINGRRYRSPAGLCTGPAGEGKDIYGNRVLFFDQLDERIFVGGKEHYYREKRWYVKDEKGVSQVSRCSGDRVFLVHENMSLEDVPEPFRREAAKLFPTPEESGE